MNESMKAVVTLRIRSVFVTALRISYGFIIQSRLTYNQLRVERHAITSDFNQVE